VSECNGGQERILTSAVMCCVSGACCQPVITHCMLAQSFFSTPSLTSLLQACSCPNPLIYALLPVPQHMPPSLLPTILPLRHIPRPFPPNRPRKSPTAHQTSVLDPFPATHLPSLLHPHRFSFFVNAASIHRSIKSSILVFFLWSVCVYGRTTIPCQSVNLSL
jgi:hypothetical protein